MGNGSLSRSIIRMNLLAFSKKKKKKKNLSAELNKLVINILFLLQNVHYNSCLFYSFLFNPKKKKKKTHTIIIYYNFFSSAKFLKRLPIIGNVFNVMS